ncbi:unnamed protein product [Cylindrotheca closterium]|uniref:CAAX prenyl protease 2/Lysostaphin resistance protein A-like domain-containing protein n=1 Tax=Cylindrotheca closterium TaxID=2856 RepID=A0AAD2FUQ7_9STRA|nr:unnamed protein product [Cylindrotheca closterium]
MLQLNIFVKYRVLLIGLFVTRIFGAPRFGARWSPRRAIPPRTVVNSPRSTTMKNVRSRPRSPRSLCFDMQQTNTTQTPTRLQNALNVTGCGLRKWREKVARDLLFEKEKTAEPISNEEPRKRHPWYPSWMISGIRCFWKGVLHVLQNYGILWALESIGTEIVHTPVKLFLEHGAHRCPSAYRIFRNGLLSCFLSLNRLAIAFEETLLYLFPVLLCHRFLPRGERSKRYASRMGLYCYSLRSEFVELVDAVVAAPIYEEFVFRFLFRQIWMQVTHLRKLIEERFKSHTTDEEVTRRKWDDLDDLTESWILPSSVLFGVAHVDNWMPLDRKYFWDSILIFLRLVGRKDIHKYPMRRKHEHTLLCSLFQSQHCLVLSLICLAPVYQHLGMMGSIGSHAILNLINGCIPNHRYILAVLSVCAGFARTIRSSVSKI